MDIKPNRPIRQGTEMKRSPAKVAEPKEKPSEKAASSSKAAKPD
ncbi:hypothetical protein ACKU27_00995 [Sphingobium yanoikuyae]|jgi:hypothetical protein